MPRASSGKHARLVGVGAAGGDSVRRIRGRVPIVLDLHRETRVSTSANIGSSVANSVWIAHRELQQSSDTLFVSPEYKPYGFFFVKCWPFYSFAPPKIQISEGIAFFLNFGVEINKN